MKERQQETPREMSNKIVPHPVTKTQPIPKQQSAPPSQFSPVYVLGMSFSVEYLFV